MNFNRVVERSYANESFYFPRANLDTPGMGVFRDQFPVFMHCCKNVPHSNFSSFKQKVYLLTNNNQCA